MTRIKLVAAIFIAVAWASALVARPASAQSTAPCSAQPSGTSRLPSIPSNLRIMRGEDLQRSPVTVSGPSAADAATLEPVASGAGSHAYFNALIARSDCWVAYSLRSQEQLARQADGGYSSCNSCPLAVTYDPVKDAAKVTITGNSLKNQVRLPIPAHAPKSLFLTWDAWWGREWQKSNTGLTNHKAFQIASPADKIWTEINTKFGLATAPNIAATGVRFYGSSGAVLGPNATKGGPGAVVDGLNYQVDTLAPISAPFMVAPETWTRYWAFFQPDGEWWAFSLWVADETRAPVRIYDRLQIKPADLSGWRSFWLEFNTSTETILGTRPLVAYVRNVVTLRNIADVSSLLERPVR